MGEDAVQVRLHFILPLYMGYCFQHREIDVLYPDSDKVARFVTAKTPPEDSARRGYKEQGGEDVMWGVFQSAGESACLVE